MKIELEPIGIIHTPFTQRKEMPRQSHYGHGIKGEIEIFESFVPGLKDLDGFSHIILVFHLHKSTSYTLHTIPYKHTSLRGLFSTRSPNRPNPIGISVVQLNKIEKNILHIQNIDMLDGTPLLDIKPYLPEFDLQQTFKTGWRERGKMKTENRRRKDQE